MLKSDLSRVLLLALLPIFYQVAEGTMTLSIQLDHYHSTNDHLANSRCCQPGMMMMCGGACNPYFIICLDTADSNATDMTTCPLGSYQTGDSQDTKPVVFTNDIGGTVNPHLTSLLNWQGGVHIGMEVRNHVTGSEDGPLIDFLQSIVHMAPGDNATVSFHNRTTLNVTVSVSCGADYYGRDCATLCDPDENDHYTCDPQTGAKLCEPDYYGPRCIQYCSMASVGGREPHYTCDTITGAKICNEGWEGFSCNTRTDPCSSSPCMEGSTCDGNRAEQTYICNCVDSSAGDVHFTCNMTTGQKICDEGWVGSSCETAVDPCVSSPCQHDSTCVWNGTSPSHTCVCTDKWAGDNCERHEVCSDNPCVGPSDCHPMGSKFFCNCHEGWDGDRCEIVVNVCDDAPCLNGGTCAETRTPTDADYSCTCPPEWRGYDCFEDVNECYDDPCNGSQTCENTDGGFTCYCANGGEGEDCFVTTVEVTTQQETTAAVTTQQDMTVNFTTQQDMAVDLTTQRGATTPYDVCHGHQCENGAACVASSHRQYSCVCASGYRGDRCEKIDNCITKPCANNGTCVNSDDGFICLCAQGYSGSTCTQVWPPLTEPPTTPDGARPHWLYAVPRDWLIDTEDMELEVHRLASKRLNAPAKEVTAEVDLWECTDHHNSKQFQLISVVIRVRGHIQSEQKTRDVVQEASGSTAEIEVLVGNETASCYPVSEPQEGAVLKKANRQELLYVLGAVLIMATVALLIAAAILISRKRSRGVFVPAKQVEEAPLERHEEANRKLVVLRKKDLKLDVNKANQRNTQRDSRIQDNFTPQCFVNLTYDSLKVAPVTPDSNPPTSSPRPLSIYKKFHYDGEQDV